MGKKARLTESEDGAVLCNLNPIVARWHMEIDYIHSYAQDSPFFAGLAAGKIMGTRCEHCQYTYATPRTHCLQCGQPTIWVELPRDGLIHTFTTCYYGSETFLKETPYTLILVEFGGVDTFLMSRLVGVDPADLRIGMPVRAKFVRLSKFRPTDLYFVRAS